MSLYLMDGVHGDGASPQTRQRDTSYGYSFASPLPTPSMMGLHPLGGGLLARDAAAAQAPTEHGTTLGYSSSFNASAVLASRQQYQIQVIAATFSSVTILSAICAVYWFYMMRRNFRRDLILLLIIGDVWKSLWFMVFSSVTLARGHIATLSPFCQASGYLLQTGIESCDVAIFLISLHMSLQIFPPKNSIIGHDGLYQVRRWVWAAWFLLPNLSASLAFIHNQAGYISQGGLCSLPIRPFWYRLGLSWIPRYLIWLFVMGVAIRIYLHVGYEFKVFAQEKDQTSSVGIPGEVSTANTTVASVPAAAMARTASTQSDSATVEKQIISSDGSAHDDDLKIPSPEPRLPETARSPPSRFGRRQSVPNWTTPFNNSVTFDIDESRAAETLSHSTPSSRRGSRQFSQGRASDSIHLPGPLDFSHSRTSIGPTRPISAQLPHDIASPALSPITEYKTYESAAAAAAATATTRPGNAAARALQERRRAIQRQLRVLFIYPVVYLMFWVIPFVAHCFSYDNYYAQHPIFALSALNVFCQTFMGFADVCIFSWRERPWRHIPGSDGTFLGSFMFWRFASASALDGQEFRRESEAISITNATAGDPTTRHPSTMHSGSRTNSHTSFFNSLRRWNPRMSSVGQGSSSQRGSNASAMTGPSLAPSTPRRVPPPAHRRAYSGGDNRRIREAELAHERLALERADWALHRQSLHGRRASAISTLQSEKKEPERKEWWDRQMSLDDDIRDDD